MQAIIDGVLVNYVRSGKGKSILLIHGWGDSSLGLKNLHQALSKKFDVINPDLPGFGSSQAPPKDWELDDFAAFINKLVSKLEVKELEAVIGHSNGGAIAIKFVLSNKVPVRKLVLLSSAGVRRPNSLKQKSTLIGTKIGKALTLPLPKSTRDKLRHKHYENIGSDMLYAEHMVGTFKKVVSEDIVDQSAGITIPTLLIYGDQDKKTPQEYGMMFHEKISGSTLEIVGGARHFVHLDEANKVIKLITEFL